MPNCHMDSPGGGAQLSSGACPFSGTGHETLTAQAANPLAKAFQAQTYTLLAAVAPVEPASVRLALPAHFDRASGPSFITNLSLLL